jgi:cobalt/nickel transport system ATP-binding protein
MSHHRLDFVAVSYRYPDGTEALHDISFSVHHGESVGIIGANGSGKSTLLGCTNGLLLPVQGQVRLAGLPVTPANLDEVRRRVGLVFQDPDDQLFMPTVLEDVAFGPLNQGLSPETAEVRAMEALEAVGADTLISKSPRHLSLGQRSAVAIAAVLALQPDVLALDEPAARLDPRSRRRLIRLLAGFQHTKLIASHDLDLVLELCDRVLVLDEGRVVADAPTRQILRDQELLEAHGLELPLTLQGALPDQPPRAANYKPGRFPNSVWHRN